MPPALETRPSPLHWPEVKPSSWGRQVCIAHQQMYPWTMYKCVPETSTQAMAMCLLGTHVCTSAPYISPLILFISPRTYFTFVYVYIQACIYVHCVHFVHLDMQKCACVLCGWLRGHCHCPLSDTLRLLLEI